MTAVLGSDKTRNKGNEETKMRKWEMEMRKWKMGNGNEEMEMGNGKWEMGNGNEENGEFLNKSIKLKWSFCWYKNFF